MATVGSVALTQPSSDPNINVGGSFTQGGQITKADHGGLDYDHHWQWDQGTGSWVDIGTSSSAGLYHAATNPVVNQSDEVEKTLTIFGGAAGSYNVRVQTVDHNDGDNTDTSGTQAVTVNAAPAGSRRIMVVS